MTSPEPMATILAEVDARRDERWRQYDWLLLPPEPLDPQIDHAAAALGELGSQDQPGDFRGRTTQVGEHRTRRGNRHPFQLSAADRAQRAAIVDEHAGAGFAWCGTEDACDDDAYDRCAFTQDAGGLEWPVTQRLQPFAAYFRRCGHVFH